MKLDEALIGRVDAAASAAGWSRTAFFERALEGALGGSPVGDSGAEWERVVLRSACVPARSVGGRVVSSGSAKAGVVPRWRDVG